MTGFKSLPFTPSKMGAHDKTPRLQAPIPMIHPLNPGLEIATKMPHPQEIGVPMPQAFPCITSPALAILGAMRRWIGGSPSPPHNEGIAITGSNPPLKPPPIQPACPWPLAWDEFQVMA